MTIKNYALVNIQNVVVNTVLIDDVSDESLFQSIAAANDAVAWYDTEIYGVTSIGGTFEYNKLWMPQPYPSWLKGETDWVAPKEKPNNNKAYVWDEQILDWSEVNLK
jgi:hypothetical protein